MSAPTTIREQIRQAALERGHDYVKTSEAATYVGYADQTLRGWRSAGRGPASLKLGGRIRYYLVDLDAWLDNAPIGGVKPAISTQA